MSSANKNNNSSSIPLKSATEFIGLAQSTSGFSNILVNIRSDKKSELTIQQSADKVNWDLHSLWTCDPAKNPTGFLVQEPASMPFFRVKLLNTSGEDMTRLRLVSVLNLTSNVKLNVRQDNTLISGEDELGEKHTLLTDASGALLVVASLSPVDNQDVTITARSGTGFLSYLTDNVAVATMPSITGTVAVSSQPYLSYLTDNVAVATQPALAFANDKVDVTGSAVSVSNFPATQPISGSVSVSNLPATQPISGSVSVSNFPATQPISGSVSVSSQPALSYLTDNVAVATLPPITGTVAVSSQPYLSYLTDNVAVATMPAITGTVAVSSQPPLSYLTDNIAVATQPALTFATDKVDATGSAVTISTALPAGANRIGEVITREDPASASNLTSINTISQQIKATPGSLMNFTAFNDGNAISYVKIYNSLTATSADTPIVTFPIRHDSAINTISTHNLQFSTAICVRATAGYAANDNTAPNGTTSVVAFYNGLL